MASKRRKCGKEEINNTLSMSKKKKPRRVIDDLIAAYEAAERNNRRREWINPESYERGKDPHYDNWKNDEQGHRLKRDRARLESEERDNYPKIIEVQDVYIQLLEEYLTKDEEYIGALRAFYEQQLQEYKQKYDEIEKRISDIEKQIAELVKEVNKNTERIDNLIKEFNAEKDRVGELARKACAEVVERYNNIVRGRICSKFCYYKLRGLERIISKFDEPKLTVDALYALAVDALGNITEIESQSELEWKKFQPIYEPFKSEVSKFVATLDTYKKIKLDDWNNEIIDLDFWTDNRFSNLVANAKQLYRRVSNGEYAQDYVLSDIKIDKDLMFQLKENLGELIVEGKNRASHAFHRQALALSAEDCLESNHCFLTSICQFEESDQRRAFVIEAECNIDEVKITLVFTPEGRDEEAWCFIQHNQYIDPNKYETLVNEIILSLKDKCGIICIQNDDSVIDFEYNDDILTIEGRLIETINNVIYNPQN